MKVSPLCKFMFAALLGAVLVPPAAAAEPNPYDGDWHYAATLYGWFPDIYSTVKFPRVGDPTLKVEPSSYLGDLQFAAMFAGEARKGDWGVATDLVYTDLSSLNSKLTHVQALGGRVALPVDADVSAGVRATIWTLVASYHVARGRAGSVDLIGGVRYGGLRVSTDWNLSGPLGLLAASGSVAETANLWDGVVGAKGELRLSDDGRWFVPFEVDVGGGKGNWTWNAIAGAGYHFSWGDLLAGYRNLEFDTTDGQPINNLRMSGPALAVTFRW